MVQHSVVLMIVIRGRVSQLQSWHNCGYECSARAQGRQVRLYDDKG